MTRVRDRDVPQTAEAAITDPKAVFGRRGFVGAMAGALTTATVAAQQPVRETQTLPGELGRHSLRTVRGTAYEAVALRVSGVDFGAAIPTASSAAGRQDVAWLESSRNDAPAQLVHAGIDAGLPVLVPRTGATEHDRLVAFHWAAEHLSAGSTVVLAAGTACTSACAVVSDRLLPRIRGLYLLDPADTLEVGPRVYWRGRRVRVAASSPFHASAPLETSWATMRAGGAEVSSAFVADRSSDLAATLRRWRTT